MRGLTSFVTSAAGKRLVGWEADAGLFFFVSGCELGFRKVSTAPAHSYDGREAAKSTRRAISLTRSQAPRLTGRPTPAPLLLRPHLRADAFLRLSELARERRTAFLRLEHLANLNLGLRARGVGAALHPFDSFFLRLHLSQPEAGDQFLHLGERAVNYGPVRSGELDACPFELGWSPSAASSTPALASYS
jgi:hypothetical protein